jgi:hypothetical protein
METLYVRPLALTSFTLIMLAIAGGMALLRGSGNLLACFLTHFRNTPARSESGLRRPRPLHVWDKPQGILQ